MRSAPSLTACARRTGAEARVPNYYDDSLSIRLPVFIIHGNHDDPTVEFQDEVCGARRRTVVIEAADAYHAFLAPNARLAPRSASPPPRAS